MHTICASLAAAWLVAMASTYAAQYLFRINAPEADQLVRNGWGFNLYAALIAGGITGLLAAPAVASRSARACVVVGGIMSLVWIAGMSQLSRSDSWEGPDLFALPLLLSVALCLWGVKRSRAR